jgi:hypothetical protein
MSRTFTFTPKVNWFHFLLIVLVGRNWKHLIGIVLCLKPTRIDISHLPPFHQSGVSTSNLTGSDKQAGRSTREM